MPDRCTPEYERVLAGMGSTPPYRRARALLAELLPLNTTPDVETVRRRTLQVGARLERAALVPPDEGAPAPAKAITLAIDAGHVKSVRTYQMRSFEVRIARVANDGGQEVVFGSMPAEADRQAKQLYHVLRRLGATTTTPVTILSDGAEGPRSLAGAASVGPTRHVLDWFHLSMRVQHVAQAVKGWATAVPAAAGRTGPLADTVSRIRWRLWHGQTERALALVGDTLAEIDALVEAADNRQARKVATLLRALETYVAGQADLIIDYAAARHRGEPISTATTESTVQRLLHRRMGRQPADALVSAGRPPDAEGPHRGDERHARLGTHRRRAIRPSTVPAGGVKAPSFATVSWVKAPRLGLPTILEPNLMPPERGHVVIVGEFGPLAEPEGIQGDSWRRDAQLERAVIVAARDHRQPDPRS